MSEQKSKRVTNTLLIVLASVGALTITTAWRGQASSDAGNQVQNHRSALSGIQRVFLSAAEAEQASEARLLPQGTRSFLNVAHQMQHGEFRWNEKGVPEGKLLIRVDLDTQMMSVFRGGHEIGTAVVLYGAEDYNTPLGSFPILAKMRDHTSSTYGAPMPYTLRLTNDGVSIHGSDVRPGFGTHGCVGVPLDFAHLLFEASEVGDQVQIIRSKSA
ncbi:L,D-transpeptidase family protein [Altericroceibacterium xinjiangense]|uniref:L,D-transpeptidase family protein n=1 Tax=Altericroceibacterium xinjiangense TaxID=762261 RepID=UPI001F499A9A|nr:L,D-transpeptidase family protein [Altericroceibacterium xinjiangense]